MKKKKRITRKTVKVVINFAIWAVLAALLTLQILAVVSWQTFTDGSSLVSCEPSFPGEWKVGDLLRGIGLSMPPTINGAWTILIGPDKPCPYTQELARESKLVLKGDKNYGSLKRQFELLLPLAGILAMLIVFRRQLFPAAQVAT